MVDRVTLPQKTRELQNHHMDSRHWNDFPFRDGDIVISTYAKSGTTWMQQIVAQLLFGGSPDLEVSPLSPWVDFRLRPKDEVLPLLEAQTHRRFLKTHLPLDALVFSPLAKYLYIGRDGRDVVWSFYNHHANHSDLFYDRINNMPGLVGPPFPRPPADIRQYWRDWLDRDGYPYWSFWENVRTWWEARDLPNVLMVHFANLKRDMPAEIRRIAAFLEIPIDPNRWDSIVEHCTFDWMKANATKTAIGEGTGFVGGARTFIHRGVNGRWVDTLTPAEVAEYEERGVAELGPDCAHWLATGERR